ncbi:hypothetical protein [Pseudonocardia nigra]|uniref:hypothetical protein n=1 Tax=Pseudonocardia nigra TaxID=1921578 RepID=UPI001C5FAA6B|nr:hypothetical protein [Pseudonocardia nigra]
MHEFPVTAELSVSFQRYAYPPTGVISALPASCGALPVVAAGDGRLLVPAPQGEAFWVGFVATHGAPVSAVRAVAVLHGGERVDLATGAAPEPDDDAAFRVPPRFAAEGVPRGSGTWWALARHPGAAAAPACRSLELAVRSGPPGGGTRVTAQAYLVGVAEFEARAGVRLPPLDPGARYGGWRLP